MPRGLWGEPLVKIIKKPTILLVEPQNIYCRFDNIHANGLVHISNFYCLFLS